MGSETVIILILLAIICVLAVMCILERKESKHGADLLAFQASRYQLSREQASKDAERIAELEAEIVRLRKIPLTQTAEKEDNSIIRAASAAQVRQITESAWGKPREPEQQDEDA
jgi:hypothetical protein